LKLKPVIITIIISLLVQPAGLCLAPQAAVTRPKPAPTQEFPWTMEPDTVMEDEVPGVCYIPGLGPVLGLFSTKCLQDPLLIDPALLDAGMVLVETEETSICGTDVHNITLDENGKINEPTVAGIPGGHEISGRVIAVGPGVNREQYLGKRVVLESHFPRLQDEAVGPSWSRLWRDPRIATDRFDIAGYQGRIPGGWTRYMLAPAGNIYHVPPRADIWLRKMANLFEPNGNAFYTIDELLGILERNSKKIKGAKVIIIGLGQQGEMMARIALGNEMQVIGVDNDESKLSQLSEIDNFTGLWLSDAQFEEKIQAALDGGEAQVVIDACGAKGAVNHYMKYLEDDGTCILFGLPNDKTVLVPGMDISIDEFVKTQKNYQAKVASRKINFYGCCGRSQDSWILIIKHFLHDGNEWLTKLMLENVHELPSLDSLIPYLFPYQGNDDSRIKELLQKKVVMRQGFSPELSAALRELRDNPDSTGLSEILFDGKQRLRFVSAEDLNLPDADINVLPLLGIVLPVDEDRQDPDRPTGVVASSP